MSPDDLAVQRREDLIPVVAQLIQELPKPEQLVLSLYVVEGLTFPEVGTVLDVPEDRVWQLYTGAMHHLHTQLSAWRAEIQEPMVTERAAILIPEAYNGLKPQESPT